MTIRCSRKQRRKQSSESGTFVNQNFSMKKVEPITSNQKKMFSDYENGSNILAIGSAGTGKTFVSLYLALRDILDVNDFEKIIIIRTAVQTRDQGFMPGSLKEKMAYYETPYVDIVNDLFGRADAYRIMKEKGSIEFMSSSFIRGLTFDNAIIIVDEMQNMTYEELRSVMTRVGESSKIIFSGDSRQDDLRNGRNHLDRSGFLNFLKVLQEMNNFSIIKFTSCDIVRSGLVKEFIIKEEQILEYI